MFQSKALLSQGKSKDLINNRIKMCLTCYCHYKDRGSQWNRKISLRQHLLSRNPKVPTLSQKARKGLGLIVKCRSQRGKFFLPIIKMMQQQTDLVISRFLGPRAIGQWG
jgi:hypothetical protein